MTLIHVKDITLTITSGTKDIYETITEINTANGRIIGAIFTTVEKGIVSGEKPAIAINIDVPGRIGVTRETNVSSTVSYSLRVLWSTIL